MSIVMEGSKLSLKIVSNIKLKLEDYKKEFNKTPGLAVILVGDDSASEIYVSKKLNTCKNIGIQSFYEKLDANISEDSLIKIIERFNQDENVDGILVQMPLPKHIDANKVVEAISPKKDVDGFHPINVGTVHLGNEGFVSCTPLGVMRLLEEYNISIEGKDVVLIGASSIVGRPLASLLLNKEATISICHIKTKNIKKYTKNADIVISATGVKWLVTEDMIKEGAVVVDVGIIRGEGNKIYGDVHPKVAEIASYITPVPGGVGPMTIAMLLDNTLKSFQERLGLN